MPERRAGRADGDGARTAASPLTREDADAAGRAWRKLFGANVPSERELRDAAREVLDARVASTSTSARDGG